jgi:hypothetical protein
MTASDRTNDGDDPVDPWAPGGAMASVPDAPSGTLSLSFEAAGAPQQVPRTSTRRRWLIGGAVVLLAGAAGTLVLSSSGDETMPSAATDPVDIAGPSPTDLPEVMPPTTLRATPPPLLADVPAATTRALDPTARLVLAAAPRESVIDIDPVLAGINPTEVVALQDDEGLYEVSLPSGRVRVTDLGFDTGQTQLVATDQAAVIWPTPEGGAQIMSTQRSVGIPQTPVDRVSWSPGTDLVYLWAGRPFPNGNEPDVVSVDVDAASIQWGPIDWVDDIDDPAILLDFDGGLLRRDTGGTYSVGPGGATLLTTGDVIANGPNHLLLRECDETRSCRLVSLATDGERTDWPIDLPHRANPQRLAGLSAGGDALLVIEDRLSADVPSPLQVLELSDGTLQPLQASPIFEGFASWDTNGAGVFYADRQLLYFDRFTGESVVVSDDLPRLRAVRTRRPTDSPICEVLDVALTRFDEMAADGAGNSVRSPAADVLDRVVALAPESLRIDAQTVVNFVNVFVSPDVANSQTVAFWPASVRDGIDALDSYAAAECRFTT